MDQKLLEPGEKLGERRRFVDEDRCVQELDDEDEILTRAGQLTIVVRSTASAR